MNWLQKFEAGLRYADFLDRYGKAEHQQRWQGVYDQVGLTDEQTALLGGFTRKLNVLCMAGAWCGDCVNQCPMFERFAEATKMIDLRFLDRDEDEDLSAELSLCGGRRVPVVVFLSEDFDECGRYGDRTLSKYREMARMQLGAACPTGVGQHDGDLLHAVMAEWLAEFERIQLMLRLSPRLRQRHED